MPDGTLQSPGQCRQRPLAVSPERRAVDRRWRVCVPPRPLLSGWLILYRGRGVGGGGVRGQKKVCVPKIDLQVRAPLINFIFFLRKNFLMWVGGWVGQPKSRGANLTPLPPPVSLSKGLVPPPSRVSPTGLGVSQALVTAQATEVALSAVEFHRPFLGRDRQQLPTASVTLDVPLTPPFDPPITLSWAVAGPSADATNGTASCVWWRWAGAQGAWSTEGCRVASASAAQVQCACTHLTEFSVLPTPNVVGVSGGDFAAVGANIAEHPGLLILQCVLLGLGAGCVAGGYVMDKRNQVPCTRSLCRRRDGRTDGTATDGCAGGTETHRTVLPGALPPPPSAPSSLVNDVSGPFFREGGFGPLYLLSLCAYNMPTVSTISRPRLLVVHSVYTLYPVVSVYVHSICQLCKLSTNYAQCLHVCPVSTHYTRVNVNVQCLQTVQSILQTMHSVCGL